MTSGRPCSLACSDFFSPEAQLGQPGADRLATDAHAGSGVQVVGQLAAERVGPLRDQLAEHLPLLLVAQLRRVAAAVRARLDPAVFAVPLPDPPRRGRRAGHDLAHVAAFQAGLKQFDDPSPHRQEKSFGHTAPCWRTGRQHT